jgi:dTDP-4-dehydrorhamnose 3,5-epimerase
MKLKETALPGVMVVEMPVFRDSRGLFQETYNEEQFESAGLPTNWTQDNYSVSARNVVRGIHYQLARPQAKLVRVLRGSVFDVALDLRRSSPTFGHYVGVELSEENRRALFIPEGFGHAFVALSDDTSFMYKVTDSYDPTSERTVLWNDPELAIEWPSDVVEPIVSPKDSNGKLLRDADCFA